MIFYFSGTGNSRWAALQIAAQTGDQAVDLIGQKDIPDLGQQEQIGLVFPVYAWGAPEPVRTFAKKLPQTGAFTFGIATCGEEAGLTLKKLARIFPLTSSYSLVMPNNYIIGSDVEQDQEIRHKIRAARQEIAKISAEIVQRKAVYRVQEGPMAWLKSGLVNAGFDHFARSTKAFYATDCCNGCGLCAKTCPASTITLVDGKPTWGKTCFQCLRCINACPQTAIQYGKSTENKGRYTIDRYVDESER